MDKQWKTIPFACRYSVSDQGDIRVDASRNKVQIGTMLKPWPVGNYQAVRLTMNDGKKKSMLVHSLVAKVWIGPRPEGFHCCHNDGDTDRNWVSNLRWDTPAGNGLDQYTHGTRIMGEKVHTAKLTDSDVLQIRKKSMSITETAKVYGISTSAVKRVRSGKTWSHI